ARDPRVTGTIEAVERELVDGGFVLRYRTVDTGDVDGLSGREGAFLACSFWLADCLSMLGRDHDARQLLDRLLGLRNDLGLLSEEYDPVAGRLVGNFPQAFSHVSLVNSASKLTGQEKPTTDHVVMGLARRSISHGMSGSIERHLGGVSARSMLGKLAKNAGAGAPRGAAQVFASAVAPTLGSRGKKASDAAVTPRRSRPTTKPSEKKPTPLAVKKAVVTGDGRSRRSAVGPAGTVRMATKQVKAPTKKAPAKKATARKGAARRPPAAGKKATATKAKAPARKGAARRPPAAGKKATSTKAKAPAKKTPTVGAATKKSAAARTSVAPTATRRRAGAPDS
ncbi:MAG TPA: glycoside hydrolase family 15 protein, partial [Acidimicrobiales bacterium]|nr:glycoside hydrolase family 15 protein [Acidimicrobiales bacterium]